MIQRIRELNLVAGSPGGGKSTFTGGYVKSYPENAIVCKHISAIDDGAFKFLPEKTTSNWRQGVAPGQPAKCKIAIEQETYLEFLRWIIANFRNGVLVIDDATIFERDRLTKEMNKLVTMRRFYGIDIWLVYHGLTLLPIEQFIFANHIILFNTNDELQYKRNKIPQFDSIQKAVLQARTNFQSSDQRIKYEPAIVKLY